jgi:hypothetical protein
MITDAVKSIIKADYERNHGGRDYSLEEYTNNVSRYLTNLGRAVISSNVIIIWDRLTTQDIEFHTINGGTPEQLVHEVVKQLELWSIDNKSACTYYDNPDISALVELQSSHYPHLKYTIKKVDLGEDMTYCLTFHLENK